MHPIRIGMVGLGIMGRRYYRMKIKSMLQERFLRVLTTAH